MAVQSGWVGTSAKAETGKAWMGEARLELRLPKAGWMSEMVGKSTEVLFINTVDRTQATIYEIMGSPSEANVYVFENTATISAATQGGWALQTGSFPAGSTLKIINRGSIRGGGGEGGKGAQTPAADGGAGGTALILNFPTTIDNTSGTIRGGGGGGGGAYTAGAGGEFYTAGGGGGAGTPAGVGGTAGSRGTGSNGSATAGGDGGDGGVLGKATKGGNGGAAGAAGATAANGLRKGAGGRGGYSVESNSNAVTWIAVGDRKGSVV